MTEGTCLNPLTTLQNIAWLYPNGIPRGVPAVNRAAGPRRAAGALGSFLCSGSFEPELVFIRRADDIERIELDGPYYDADGATLKKIITNGLRIMPDSVSVISVPQIRVEPELIVSIKAQITALKPQIAIVFDPELARVLELPLGTDALIEWSGVQMLVSPRLQLIANDAGEKRKFWDQLKAVMSYLGNLR